MNKSATAFLRYYNGDTSIENVKNILTEVSATALFYLNFNKTFDSILRTLVDNAIFSFRISETEKQRFAEWLYQVSINKINVYWKETHDYYLTMPKNSPFIVASRITWCFNEDRKYNVVKSLDGSSFVTPQFREIELDFSIDSGPNCAVSFKYFTTDF